MCTHTNLFNADGLQSKSSGDMWLSFMESWATVYIVNSNEMPGDREPGIISQFFPGLVEINGIEL